MATTTPKTSEDSDDEESFKPAKSSYDSPNSDFRVTLDPDTKRLSWPVMFLYPEYQETDLIASFHEDFSFSDHFQVMFEQVPNWDKKGQYEKENLEVFFETGKGRKDSPKKLLKVGKDTSLGLVLSHEDFTVVDGMASFFILPKGSTFTKAFKKRYQK